MEQLRKVPVIGKGIGKVVDTAKDVKALVGNYTVKIYVQKYGYFENAPVFLLCRDTMCI